MITLSRRAATFAAAGLTTVTAAITAGALAIGPVAAERPDPTAPVAPDRQMLQVDDAAIEELQGSATALEATAAESSLSAGYLGNDATTFVPVAPCRIADTRLATAGKIAANTIRNFRVTGSAGFSGQGGVASGCGIPENAVAIAAGLKAVAPGASGYMRAWAYNTPQPPSTALTFTKAVDIGDAAVVPIGAPGQTYQLTTKPYKGSIHLLIDVTGYYVLNDHGMITADGGLSSGGATLWSIEKPETGTYALAVDHDINWCSYTATPYDADLVASTSYSLEYINEFFVHLQDRATGAPKDGNFYYTVTC